MHFAPNYYTIYETILKGTMLLLWTHDYNEVMILGCTTYHNFTSYSSWNSTNNYNVLDPNLVYGLCFRGYIHTIEVYDINWRWDSIYNADNAATEKPAIIGFVELMMFASATDKRFKVGNGGPADQFVVEDTLPQDTMLFEWDSAVAEGVTPTNPKVRNTAIGCKMLLKPVNEARPIETPPFYVPYIGRIFSNKTQYYACEIEKKFDSTLTAFLPAMFTMEVWFRLDPVDMRPNGYIS